jgi:predicted permease
MRIDELVRRLFHLFRRERVTEELEEEMRLHLELRADANRRAGMGAGDAESAARRRFGNRGALQMDSRDAWGLRTLESFAERFRHAFRSFRRRPLFFAVSTLTLGVALAFSTSVFSLVDGFKHPPNPFPEPDRTFWLQWYGAGDPVHPGATGDQMIEAVRRVDAFDGLASSGIEFKRVRAGDQEGLRTIAPVSPNFLRVLRVRPRIGRDFGAGDARLTDAVIVSDRLWRASFQNRPAIGGATISVEDRTYTVIGVMPRGMSYAGPFRDADVWRLGGAGEAQGGAACCFLSAHLRPGAQQKSAYAQLATIAAQLTHTFGQVGGRVYGFTLNDLRPPSRQLDAGHVAMLLAAFCTLFVACANIAALMLARAVARRRDLALRLSLGATQRSLAFEQLAEAAVLAVSGGAAGLLFTVWAGAAIGRAIPPEARWIAMLDPHWSGSLFAMVFGALACVVVLTGALPAWQVSRIEPMEPLKEASGGSTGRTAHRMKVVVATEFAAALVLLVGASLGVRSALRIARFDFGFDPGALIGASGRFVYRWDLNLFHWPDAASALLPRVLASPGIVSATTIAAGQPEHNQIYSDVTTGGSPPILAGSYLIVGARFFETTRIRLLRGRDFQEGDAVRGAVIVDERAVPALFPDGKVIGRRVKFGSPEGPAPWLEVIGVAKRADLVFPSSPDGPRWPPIYASVPHQDPRMWQIIARSSGDVRQAALRLDRTLNSLLPASAPADVEPFDASYQNLVRSVGINMKLFGALGIASLLLTATGLFAVLAYTVHQRLREFGVRVALGAQAGHLLRLVLKDGAEMALAGTGVGAFGAMAVIALGVPISGPLYGIEPTDVVALIVAEGVLLLVALAACAVPAVRAMRADAVEILRAN